ncbi:MAG: hypothetical protein CM15mP49_25590 [Actinomycetota bacterium]|nr:MAG: hypothetical protein CM15mP49_25590 [Actinomycetota bacterium]
MQGNTQALGHVTFTITDVGVSGLHRLTEALPEIIKANLCCDRRVEG